MYDPLQSNGRGPGNSGIALIFDMDGVIVDSNPAHRQAWVAFNLSYGIRTTEAMLEFMYGRRNDEIVRGFFGEGLSDEEVTARGLAKERLFREMTSGQVEDMLSPGLRAFLERHREQPMAVASNAEPANVEFVLSEAGLNHYFRTVLNGDHVARPKPFPDIYLLAAERLGTPPRNCIVFEDSYSGVEAARVAGARVVGVRTTHSELPGADFTIADFLDKDLETWLGDQIRSA